MFIYLHCLSAAFLCYTGFQNQSLISLIRSIFSPCSTCCFGLGFSTTKPTCRNTSKDLGHNSRTSFSPCCCALFRPVFCCGALCCVLLLWLVLPCPVSCSWPLSVAPGSCAFQYPVLSCLFLLCALCCVCFAVVRFCALLFATVLCAVCVLGCCAVRCLSSPPCGVLHRAVLVLLHCALCLVCAVSDAWCCCALLPAVRFFCGVVLCC